MKIRNFCAKLCNGDDSVFRALRELQKTDVQTLLERSSFGSWDPWTCCTTFARQDDP